MLEATTRLERVLISISGRVQGVGFRPFIYRLAHEHGLAGSVNNTCTGVRIDVQGTGEALARFQQNILQQKPERATITEFQVSQAPLCDVISFTITKSQSQSNTALALLPDTAMCHECLQELFDPHNRRYLYPFLHCVSCGPRFSLFLRMPFDRDNTTMTEFSMCEECRAEYANPKDRRFYSQTNCCPKCGPLLQLVDARKNVIAGTNDAVEAASNALQQGKIVAMKNTGGYLLLADGTNEKVVERLRLRKRRQSKPFALLMPSLEYVETIACVGEAEKNSLSSSAAPIVLLRKREGEKSIAFSVAHDSPYYGVMLPHNPLQHLLMLRFSKPLIATSGNISGMPLCISEEEAFAALSSVADLFLIHNRTIMHRLDDSIVHVIEGQPVIMRKARGYIPCAIPVTEQTHDLFAAGSHLKNSFAFLKGTHIYMSQFIGDLDSVDTCKAYDSEVDSWEKLLGMQTIEGIGDKHPDYYSSEYLQKRGVGSKRVQHHKAHVLAGMVDSSLSPPFFSIAWDGTGCGDDGTVWGGEGFLVDEHGIKRIASLYPFLLPGGEKAVQEPRRALLGFLYSLSGYDCFSTYQEVLREFFTEEEFAILPNVLKKKVNAPICTSMGRLFDAISALVGLCKINSFEGQAALLLEKKAYEATANAIRYEMPVIKEKNLFLLDWRPLIQHIYKDLNQGVLPATIAMAFHETVARAVVELAKLAGQETVLLTGGVMQNKLLVERAVSYLRAAGFQPYIHRDIPPNDGGIAVGQVIGAMGLCST